MHYVKKKKGEKHIGVIRPRIRVRNEISRFLRFLSSSTSRLPLLDLTPDSTSPEHISDPKGANGKFMNSTPPFGTSAENPGALDLVRNPSNQVNRGLDKSGFCAY